MAAVVAEAMRLSERGKPDCAAAKVQSASASGYVLRKRDDFVWLSEQLSMRFPGAVLPPTPGSLGALPAARNVAASDEYLARWSQCATRYVARIVGREEFAQSECVTAFLYAPDEPTFSAAKTKLDADAKRDSLLAGRRHAPTNEQAGRVAGALDSLRRLVRGPQTQPASEDAQTADRGGSIGRVAAPEKAKVKRPPRPPPPDGAAIDAALDVLRRRGRLDESAVAAAFEAALDREHHRDECEVELARRANAIAVATARRDDEVRHVAAALRALARYEFDPRASQPLADLSEAMARAGGGGAAATAAVLATAVEDARLSTLCAVSALRDRAVVAAAVGNAKARAARERTLHARAEAALAMAREKQRDARIGDDSRQLPVVDAVRWAAPAEPRFSAPSPVTRAVALTSAEREGFVSPLAAAMAQGAEARVAEPLRCDGGRISELVSCGAVKKSPANDAVKRRVQADAAMRDQEAKAAQARAVAASADEAERRTMQALEDATQRVAVEFAFHHRLRGADLAQELKLVARENIAAARAQREAFEVVRARLALPSRAEARDYEVPARDYEAPARDYDDDNVFAAPPGNTVRAVPVAPGYAQPTYAQPGYAQPSYSQPIYARQDFAQPGSGYHDDQQDFAQLGSYPQSSYPPPGYPQPGFAQSPNQFEPPAPHARDSS
eukprot:CAMPEP_0184256338 /NCGR_PEP_ID=MMETSP0977-20130417/8677_1 /TAXON_ID=483370 /ORGANISM="non described non described, Strain CCMP2097" /LENGTH=672 /DNA_ID=CAMNT_0026561925 /DNA_START=75 /DNA_END=2090 /DNA_ORIENTATION=+